MRNLFYLLFFISSSIIYAQNISGTVRDHTGSPIGFAVISLLTESKTLVNGTTADTDGKFTIASPPAGKYLLQISAAGFKILERPLDISVDFAKVDLADIVLTQDAQQLKEVSVESLRPVITQEADKMVVRVEGTAMASGNTAYALLAKMPGVFVDPEGNISLNGKGGVTVMIDDKLTYLSAADLRNMLEAMPAENVKSIDIISNPSAKYDAEGTSGILNFNLKKNTLSGVSGSVFSGYSYNFRNQHNYNGGTSINYKKGNWNTFLSVDANHREGGRDATFTRIFYGDETVYFNQDAIGNFKGWGPPSVRAVVDYRINSRHTVGVMGSFLTNTFKSDFLTETYIGNDPSSSAQFIDADNFQQNRHTNFKVNLHHSVALDTTGTSLTTDFDYVRIKNKGDSHFYNYFTDLANQTLTTDFLYSANPNSFDIYAIKSDFVHSLNENQKFETGAKASRVKSDNDSQFYFNNAGLVPDPLRTNHFIYEEYIIAGYFSWQAKLSDKWNVKAGLRAENTISEGESYTTGDLTKRDYLSLFPTVFVQQTISENYGINYNYSRRITRPNYGSLNPFRAYRDPYTWYEGNPFLRPQFTHSFGMSHVINKTYHFTFGYDYEQDVISEIPYLDVENSTTIYTTGNMDHGQSFDFTALIPIRFTSWWDSQNTALVFYNSLELETLSGTLRNEQLSYSIQSNHVLKLPKDFRVEADFRYQGPAANGLYDMAAMHRVDVAIKKSFLNKKLEAVLRANDIFKGWNYLWTTDLNGNVNDFDQYFRIRSIGLSLRYNFSKGEKVEAVRSTTVEELNRT